MIDDTFVTDIEELIRAIVPELRRFEKKNPKAIVGKLGLFTDAGKGVFVLGLDAAEAKSWRAATFTQPRLAALHEKPALRGLVQHGEEDVGPVLLAGAAALSCVEGMGHLPFEIADDFDYLLIDGGEPEAKARNRMKKANLWLTNYGDRSRFGEDVS